MYARYWERMLSKQLIIFESHTNACSVVVKACLLSDSKSSIHKTYLAYVDNLNKSIKMPSIYHIVPAVHEQ